MASLTLHSLSSSALSLLLSKSKLGNFVSLGITDLPSMSFSLPVDVVKNSRQTFETVPRYETRSDADGRGRTELDLCGIPVILPLPPVEPPLPSMSSYGSPPVDCRWLNKGLPHQVPSLPLDGTPLISGLRGRLPNGILLLLCRIDLQKGR